MLLCPYCELKTNVWPVMKDHVKSYHNDKRPSKLFTKEAREKYS